MNALPQFLGAAVGDIAGAFAIPGGNVMGLAVQGLFKKRLEQARNILLEEIRAGEKDALEAIEIDEVVAIVYRYMRAAQEGTAHVNLRLLAQVIAGQKKLTSLKADEFLYYADLIASLRREEIILLGCMQKHFQEPQHVMGSSQAAYEPQKLAQLELIPSTFKTEDDFNSCITALNRTGLVIGTSSYGGMMMYRLSPLMAELSKLASFQDALANKEDKK